jgi:hypothetical protein
MKMSMSTGAMMQQGNVTTRSKLRFYATSSATNPILTIVTFNRHIRVESHAANRSSHGTAFENKTLIKTAHKILVGTSQKNYCLHNKARYEYVNAV